MDKETKDKQSNTPPDSTDEPRPSKKAPPIPDHVIAILEAPPAPKKSREGTK